LKKGYPISEPISLGVVQFNTACYNALRREERRGEERRGEYLKGTDLW
jgi:hypothetical protein